MTLIYELDLDILKVYRHTKTGNDFQNTKYQKFPCQGFQRL